MDDGRRYTAKCRIKFGAMKNKTSIPGSQRTPGEEREYCYRAAVKIVKLCEPVKSISISRLRDMKAAQLEQIGRAARELYDVLDSHGLVSHVKKER